MKTFLVALDTSSRAEHVLAAAIQSARDAGAKLLLLRVAHFPLESPSVLTISTDSLLQLVEQDARKHLAEQAAQVPPELLAGKEVRAGVPWSVICQVAREREVDLIVIGAHGYNVVERVLGTTSGRVVTHADRSVLVVR